MASSSISLFRAAMVKPRRRRAEEENCRPLPVCLSSEVEELNLSPKKRLARFVIAATTMAGISIIAMDTYSAAMAAPFVGDGPSASSAFVGDGSSASFVPISAQKVIAMAIPVEGEEVWVFARDGSAVPAPYAPKRRAPTSRNDGRCPPWTPSELEMVLPDFHGRPKPFPRTGHPPQWWAAAHGQQHDQEQPMAKACFTL